MKGCERDRIDSPRSVQRSGAGREKKSFSLKSFDCSEAQIK